MAVGEVEKNGEKKEQKSGKEIDKCTLDRPHRYMNYRGMRCEV